MSKPLTPEELLVLIAELEKRIEFLEQWAAMRANPDHPTPTV